MMGRMNSISKDRVGIVPTRTILTTFMSELKCFNLCALLKIKKPIKNKAKKESMIKHILNIRAVEFDARF